MSPSPFSRRRVRRVGLRSRRRTGELAAALVLLGSSNVLVNRVLPGWAYPIVNGATAVSLLGLARRAGLAAEAVGLERRHLRRSAVVGLAGMALVAAAYGVAFAVPALRPVFDDGRMGDPATAELLWIGLVRIPVGTVLLEEVAFRGVLPGLFGADARWRWSPVLAASSLFGAWHILPSMALGQNAAFDAALGTVSGAVIAIMAVAASAAAGMGLCWVRHAGRGLLAPALVHVATNSGGVLFAGLAFGGG
jgi:membrane protease YdiL (CAAX protease family)